jgi:hypothetical protein
MKVSLLTTPLIVAGVVAAETYSLPSCAVSANFAPF